MVNKLLLGMLVLTSPVRIRFGLFGSMLYTLVMAFAPAAPDAESANPLLENVPMFVPVPVGATFCLNSVTANVMVVGAMVGL